MDYCLHVIGVAVLFNRVMFVAKSLWLKFLSILWQLKLWAVDAPFMFTAHKNKLPDFLIIGVPKAGTTYLYDILNQHSKIQMSRRKEIHFFDKNYHRGKRYYQSFFPKSDLGMLTGEASVNYFYSDKAKTRIERDLPNVKLILLLRNPADRAYSHFQMNRKDMVEKSFDQHIASNSLEFKKYNYLEKGLYAKYLTIWNSFLKSDNLLIINSEDLFHKEDLIINRVLSFLELPSDIKLLSRNKNSRVYEKMKPDTRSELMDYYKEDMANLEEYLSENFNWHNEV